MSGKNDLKVTKVIKAPPSVVWKAWREPEHFVKWWAPAPVRTVSNKHEFHAGGAFDTTMHLPDGTVMDGGEGCFLEVVENERIHLKCGARIAIRASICDSVKLSPGC